MATRICIRLGVGFLPDIQLPTQIEVLWRLASGRIVETCVSCLVVCDKKRLRI